MIFLETPSCSGTNPTAAIPPPFPFPLFRIWTSDWRRYFPSSGALHARPTTPHPPSASCLGSWTLDTGRDLLESMICCPDNALTWSHLFQDRLEIRRSPVLCLQYLDVRCAHDIGVSLAHVRLVDLFEDGFDIDSVGDAGSVDDVQEIGECI